MSSPSSYRSTVDHGLDALLDAFEDPAALIDAAGEVVLHNRAWEAHGFEDASFCDGDPIPLSRVLSGETRQVAGVGRRSRPDGWRWYRSRIRAIDLDGFAAVLTHRDVTDERRLHNRMSTSPVAHLELARDGSLQNVNERWEQIRGRPVGAELGHRWLRDTDPSERDAILARMRTAEAFEVDLRTVGGDDRSRVVAMRFAPLFDDGEWIGWEAWAIDQTERRELEDAASQAFIDSVTGLANRPMFEASLERALARRPDRPAAVLFIDMDGFKQVNDNSGHAAGDAVLRAAGGRITSAVRPADLVARFGGDEFAVLIEPADDSPHPEVGERIVRAFDTPIVHDGDAVELGVSVGVATRIAGDTVESIIRRADRAMYRAKRAGGNRVEIA